MVTKVVLDTSCFSYSRATGQNSSVLKSGLVLLDFIIAQGIEPRKSIRVGTLVRFLLLR